MSDVWLKKVKNIQQNLFPQFKPHTNLIYRAKVFGDAMSNCGTMLIEFLILYDNANLSSSDVCDMHVIRYVSRDRSQLSFIKVLRNREW